MSATLLQVLCIFSGFTGLVYETLWIRVLSLGVGSTSASMSIVLSIFFFGLSAGAFVLGRYATRFKPVLFYGGIEAGIGLYAALVILPLFELQALHVNSFIKYLIVTLAILPPTMGMGATLPILAKVFVRSAGNAGTSVGRLYALNTLGAVLGALSTAFVLIPTMGILASNFFAVGLNLAIGLATFFLSRRLDVGFETPRTKVIEPVKSPIQLRDRWVLAATAICGFSSIACQVVWNKYLGIFFGTNIYGLGLTLAVFLIGIVVGSFLFSVTLAKSNYPIRWFMALLGIGALAVWVTSFELSRAPYIVEWLAPRLSPWLSLLTLKSFLAVGVLLFPTCIFGALFPLAISLLIRKDQEISSVVGKAYGINTLGSILGAYLAGMVLIPAVGSSYTIQLAALLLVGMGLAALLLEPLPYKKGFASLAALLMVSIVTTGFFNFKPIISSAYPSSSAKEAGEQFLMIEEGETAVISLSHDPRDGEQYQRYLRLKTNGLNESVFNLDNLGELPKYEALIGLLPYVFSRNPKTAFVVGYGGGFTVDFLSSTDLEHVNVVELEKGILKAADFVHRNDNPILKRKNVHLTIEDARYSLVSRELGPQDIVVSQPSHSWLTGAANLFTEDFFLIVKDNLSERGVFAQWLNLYNMDVDVLQSIIRTFFTVFPHGAIFTESVDDELVLLGSKQPLVMNFQKVNLLSKNPQLKKKLTQVFHNSPYNLLSLYSVSRNEALSRTREARLNTDSNAYAETRQSTIFYEGLKDKEQPQAYLASLFLADFESITSFHDIIRYSERYPLDKAGECHLGNALVKTSEMVRAEPLFKKMSDDVEEYTEACGNFFNRVMGEYFLKKDQPRIAIPFLEAYYASHSRDPGLVAKMIQGYQKIGDTSNEEQFVSYLKTLKAE